MPEVVGEAVLDFVERAAFGAGSRIEGGGIGAVASADVEAHDTAGGLAGDRCRRGGPRQGRQPSGELRNAPPLME